MNNKCVLPANVIGIVEACAKEQQLRFSATTGVEVRLGETGYRLAATDGRKLAIITGPIGDAEPAMLVNNPADSAVLPAQSFALAFGPETNHAPSEDYEPDPDLRLAFVSLDAEKSSMRSSVHQDTGASTITDMPNVPGKFPPTEKVVPSGEKLLAKIDLDAANLANLAKIVNGIAENGLMTLEIHDMPGSNGANVLVMRAKNSKGQEITGVLAPLVK